MTKNLKKIGILKIKISYKKKIKEKIKENESFKDYSKSNKCSISL